MDDKIFQGKINAVDAVVDEATRNVLVQATLANPGGLLRPGMFVVPRYRCPTQKNGSWSPPRRCSSPLMGIRLHRRADYRQGRVLHRSAPAGGESWRSQGDRVSILSGVKPGEQVVTSGVFKLRQGSHVQINNTIQPANNDKPKPEDS